MAFQSKRSRAAGLGKEHHQGLTSQGRDGRTQEPPTSQPDQARRLHRDVGDLAHEVVSLRLLPERIDVVAESQRIASHVRSFERSRTFYDWCHYVSLIERKRGTLRNGESLRTEPEPLKKLQAILLRHKGDRFMAHNEPAW